jgi:hypothetical protein
MAIPTSDITDVLMKSGFKTGNEEIGVPRQGDWALPAWFVLSNLGVFRALANRVVFPGLETVAAGENVCGDFRQCHENPALDGADRHAGGEIPATAIDIRLVPFESGGTPAAVVVCLSWCERLEIRIIAASSPQVKGRVERNNGVHQDRLVKKLRRQGIQSYPAANEYLEAEYLAEHNRRFARAAARAENYQVRAPSAAKLREVFRLETERWISNDWVVQYRGHFLQLKPQNQRYGPTQAKALVCE